MKKVIIGVGIILGGVLLLSACAGGAVAPPTAERTFYLNAIEIKGGTSADKLAPPTINPEDLGKSFGYNAPGFNPADPTRWEVASYQFNPSALTVFQGDTVKLVLFVVNGDIHADRIEDPNGQIVVAEQTHNRGRLYTMSFVAQKAGVYQLRCKEHAENMRLLITVIPSVK